MQNDFPPPPRDFTKRSFTTGVFTHFGNYSLTLLQGLLNYCLYQTRAVQGYKTIQVCFYELTLKCGLSSSFSFSLIITFDLYISISNPI